MDETLPLDLLDTSIETEIAEAPPSSLFSFDDEDLMPVFSIMEVWNGPKQQSRSLKQLSDLRFCIEIAGGIIMQTPYLRPEHNITLLFFSRDNALNNVKFNEFHEMLEENEIVKDLFHENFIWEMVRTRAIPDLNRFRLGTSHFEEYNANDILTKKIKWSDLTLKNIDLTENEAKTGLEQDEPTHAASCSCPLQRGIQVDRQEQESISDSEYFSATDTVALDSGECDPNPRLQNGIPIPKPDLPPRSEQFGRVTRAMAARRRSASMSPISSASTTHFGIETSPSRRCSSKSPLKTKKDTGGIRFGRDFAAALSPYLDGETEILSRPLNAPAPAENVVPSPPMTRSKQASRAQVQQDDATHQRKGRKRKPRKPSKKDKTISQSSQEADFDTASTSAQAGGSSGLNFPESQDSTMASLAVNSPSDQSSVHTTPQTVEAAPRRRPTVAVTAEDRQLETSGPKDAGTGSLNTENITKTLSTPDAPKSTPSMISSLTLAHKSRKSKQQTPVEPPTTQSHSSTIVSSNSGPSISSADSRKGFLNGKGSTPIVPTSIPSNTSGSAFNSNKSKELIRVPTSATQHKTTEQSDPGPSTSPEVSRRTLNATQSAPVPPVSTPSMTSSSTHKKGNKSKDQASIQAQSKSTVSSNSEPSTTRETCQRALNATQSAPVPLIPTPSMTSSKVSKFKELPPPEVPTSTQTQPSAIAPCPCPSQSSNKTTIGVKRNPVFPSITTSGFFQKPAAVEPKGSSMVKITYAIPQPGKGQSTMTPFLYRQGRYMRDSPESERAASPNVPRKRFRPVEGSRVAAASAVCEWVNQTDPDNVPPEDVPHIDSEEEEEASQHRSVSMSPISQKQKGVKNRAEPRVPSQTTSAASKSPAADDDQAEQTRRDNNPAEEQRRVPSHNSRQGQPQTKPPQTDADGWIPTRGKDLVEPSCRREAVAHVEVRDREQPSTSRQAYSHSRNPTSTLSRGHEPTNAPPPSPRHEPRNSSPVIHIETSSSSEESEDRNIPRGSSVSRSSTVTRKKFFSHAEQQRMVEWVCERGDHDRIGSRSLYLEMEEANICPGRTHQSLSNNFRKNVVFNLHKFQMSENDRKTFKRRVKGLRY